MKSVHGHIFFAPVYIIFCHRMVSK